MVPQPLVHDASGEARRVVALSSPAQGIIERVGARLAAAVPALRGADLAVRRRRAQTAAGRCAGCNTRTTSMGYHLRGTRRVFKALRMDIAVTRVAVVADTQAPPARWGCRQILWDSVET